MFSHIIYPCVFNIGVIHNANINSPLSRLNIWAKPHYIILHLLSSAACGFAGMVTCGLLQVRPDFCVLNSQSSHQPRLWCKGWSRSSGPPRWHLWGAGPYCSCSWRCGRPTPPSGGNGTWGSGGPARSGGAGSPAGPPPLAHRWSQCRRTGRRRRRRDIRRSNRMRFEWGDKKHFGINKDEKKNTKWMIKSLTKNSELYLKK